METETQFFSRIYVNFAVGSVWVYANHKMDGTPQNWTIQQARQYLNYLEQQRG